MNKMLYISIFIVLIAFLILQQLNARKIKDNRIELTEFKKGILQKDVQLIDVRTASEFKSGHINGAKNIDVLSAQFKERIKNLETSKPTYLYCRSGKRSQKALKIMLNQGFVDVYDLVGGYTIWTSDK